MFVMLAPVPNRSFSVSSGAVYVADANGILANVATQGDRNDLAQMGCSQLSPNPTNLLGYLKAANFNVTTDQQVANLAANTKFQIRRITVMNTSVAGMSTAAGGLYTATSKGGTAIVAAGQLYTGLTNAATGLDLTLAAPNAILLANTPLYFSLTTGQGAAATADIYVYGDAIP